MNRVSLLLLLALLLPACTSKNEPPRDAAAQPEILVSVAASLKESMEELGRSFEKHTGTKVLFNFAGSNELARQIVATPKVDIFLSAAENWMDTVEKAGRLVPNTRRDILSNALVVIGGTGGTFRVGTPCDLATLQFRNLALGDPESVPAGRYARKWLSGIRCGSDTLWTMLKARVAPAPDVRAALSLVTSDPEMIGIVYRTDQLQFADRTRVLFEVTDGPPIRYVLAQVAEGSAPEAARTFLEYLSGAEAQAVFQKHGFTTIPIAAATP